MPHFNGFYAQLRQICQDLPPPPLEYSWHTVLIDRHSGELFTPDNLEYNRCTDSGHYFMTCYAFSGSARRELIFTTGDFLRDLVAYQDRGGVLHVFNPGVVNDVLLKSIKDFSDAISKETKEEATKESVQQSLSVKPDQRPSWMP